MKGKARREPVYGSAPTLRSVTLRGLVAFFVALGAAATSASPAFAADSFDALQCFKAKDTMDGKPRATMDLVAAALPGFAATPGCTLKVKSRELCVPADVGVFDAGGGPVTGVGGPELTNAFVCYRTRCSDVTPPELLELTDLFGTRNFFDIKESSKRVCVPATF